MIFSEKLEFLHDNLNPFKNALVTGTTGFLGSALLCELLQNTNYIFYCLVRAESEEKDGINEHASRLGRFAQNC